MWSEPGTRRYRIATAQSGMCCSLALGMCGANFGHIRNHDVLGRDGCEQHTIIYCIWKCCG